MIVTRMSSSSIFAPVCRPFGGVVSLKDPADDELEGLKTISNRMAHAGSPICCGLQDRIARVLRRVSHRLAQEGIDVTDLYGLRRCRPDVRDVPATGNPREVEIAELQRDLTQLLAAEGIAVGLFHDPGLAGDFT